MKKNIILFCCCLFFICLIIGYSKNEKTTPQLNNNDCSEFGICGEGLTAIIENETFVINKDTCLKHKKQWRDDLRACYMR